MSKREYSARVIVVASGLSDARAMAQTCQCGQPAKPSDIIKGSSSMTLHTVNILFQLIVFLFAISIHESAHAWMANRCGDPTARMLGRITLNPIKHIDPIGTILLPLIAVFAHFPAI